MTKEKIFKEITSIVSDLINGKEIKDLSERNSKLQKSVQEISPKDRVWLNEEYSKWHHNNVKPFINSLPPEVKGQILHKNLE